MTREKRRLFIHLPESSWVSGTELKREGTVLTSTRELKAALADGLPEGVDAWVVTEGSPLPATRRVAEHERVETLIGESVKMKQPP